MCSSMYPVAIANCKPRDWTDNDTSRVAGGGIMAEKWPAQGKVGLHTRPFS